GTRMAWGGRPAAASARPLLDGRAPVSDAAAVPGSGGGADAGMGRRGDAERGRRSDLRVSPSPRVHVLPGGRSILWGAVSLPESTGAGRQSPVRARSAPA